MTPQEEAIKLRDEFEDIIYKNLSLTGNGKEEIFCAKECAIIAQKRVIEKFDKYYLVFGCDMKDRENELSILKALEEL